MTKGSLFSSIFRYPINDQRLPLQLNFSLLNEWQKAPYSSSLEYSKAPKARWPNFFKVPQHEWPKAPYSSFLEYSKALKARWPNFLN